MSIREKIIKRLKESTDLHDRVYNINTPKFKGIAHVEVASNYKKKGKGYDIDTYHVTYKGKFVDNKNGETPHESNGHYLHVYSQKGTDYKVYKSDGSTSKKSPEEVLHKAAPSLVNLSQLK